MWGEYKCYAIYEHKAANVQRKLLSELRHRSAELESRGEEGARRPWRALPWLCERKCVHQADLNMYGHGLRLKATT